MSHTLFHGTAAFRRVDVPRDGDDAGLKNPAKTAAQRAGQSLVTVLAPPGASSHRGDPPPLVSVPSGLPAASTNPATGRAHPSVPFYGLLTELDVALVVPRDATTTRDKLVDTRLDALSTTAGVVYYLGTQSATDDPDMRAAHATSASPFANSVSSTASETSSPVTLRLSYSAYVAALTDGFAQLTRLRELAAVVTPTGAHPAAALTPPALATSRPPPTHVCPHTVHVRIAGHPRWKDLSVMLCVERGRLVLYLSASSRLTQDVLTARARHFSLELTWMAGATMVEEPAVLAPHDVNPILVAWDCFLALPLLASTAAEAGQALSDADGDLSGFYVAVVSSLPLTGAERHGVCLRRTRDTENERQRRRVWRLVARGGPRGPTVVLPNFWMQLVSALVDLCTAPLGDAHASFDLVCAGDARGSTSRLSGSTQWWRRTSAQAATKAAAAPPAAADRTGSLVRPQGLTYVTTQRGGAAATWGSAQLYAPIQSASSQTWLGFSRLSCASWVLEEERLLAGIEDDEECEFNLLGLHFHSLPPPAREEATTTNKHGAKRARPCDKDDDNKQFTVLSDAGVVDTSHWPHGFAWRVAVARIMTHDDSNSGEDGGL